MSKDTLKLTNWSVVLMTSIVVDSNSENIQNISSLDSSETAAPESQDLSLNFNNENQYVSDIVASDYKWWQQPAHQVSVDVTLDHWDVWQGPVTGVYHVNMEMTVSWIDERIKSPFLTILPIRRGLWTPGLLHSFKDSPVIVNNSSIQILVNMDQTIRCFYHSFHILNYILYCPLHQLGQYPDGNYTWKIHPKLLPLSIVSAVTLVTLENETKLGLKFYNKQMNNLFLFLVIYGIIYVTSLVLIFSNSKYKIFEFLPLLLATIFPLFYSNLTSFDPPPASVILLFFGWNIFLTTMPLLYQVLASTQKSKISPNVVRNNKSFQIDMYASTKDEAEDRMSKQHKSRNFFVIVYILFILISLSGLLAIFYSSVKEHILDLLRKNI